MYFSEQTFSLCPFGIAPHRSIDREMRKCGSPDPAFNSGSYDEGADANCQFTQFYFSSFSRYCIIDRGGNTDTATNAAAMNSGNDKLWSKANGVDHVSKSTKELHA